MFREEQAASGAAQQQSLSMLDMFRGTMLWPMTIAIMMMLAQQLSGSLVSADFAHVANVAYMGRRGQSQSGRRPYTAIYSVSLMPNWLGRSPSPMLATFTSSTIKIDNIDRYLLADRNCLIVLGLCTDNSRVPATLSTIPLSRCR